MRDDQDFDAAHRHSKLVAILKNALPICALVVVILFVLLAVTTTIPLPGLEIDRVGLQEGKLIMENPKLVGFDRRSRPYDVGAQQAIQDLARPGIVELKSIAAKLPMDAASFADIRAIVRPDNVIAVTSATKHFTFSFTRLVR